MQLEGSGRPEACTDRGMAQAVLGRHGRRPTIRGSKLILVWALLAALAALLVLAAIGFAKSAGVVGRWIVALSGRQSAPAVAPSAPPPPAAPELVAPPPPPLAAAPAPVIAAPEEPAPSAGGAGPSEEEPAAPAA